MVPVRPFLLRRGTSGAPTGGSFKRRSLKLRRGTKDGKDIEADCKYYLHDFTSLYLVLNKTQRLNSKYDEPIPFNREGKFRPFPIEVIHQNREQLVAEKNLLEF